MKIEMVTIKTAEAAGQIHALAWKAGYQGILPQSYLDALSPQLWISRMKQAVYQDFLLKDHGHYVAASSLSPARDKNMSGWGEIVSLYVLPEHIRKGYGSALLSYGIGQLQAQGLNNIYLWVLEENHRARAFYEAMGFVPNGDRAALPIGGAEWYEIRYVNQR